MEIAGRAVGLAHRWRCSTRAENGAKLDAREWSFPALNWGIEQTVFAKEGTKVIFGESWGSIGEGLRESK